ncbi:MAG: carboxypeptidase M32 [Planctomycetota bacterium]|nr:MAG: carboxypeptidase M32 [Planctomycetota bacterium]
MDLELKYLKLKEHFKNAKVIESCAELIGWDERTNMPPQGADLRALQNSALSKLHHDLVTESWLGDALNELASESVNLPADSDICVNVREWIRVFTRANKIPVTLVQEFSKTFVYSQQAWQDARSQNNFALFQPWLEKIIDLKRHEAKCLANGQVSYDALLDDYEPGATSLELDSIFYPLKDTIIKVLHSCSKENKRNLILGNYPEQKQKIFSEIIAGYCGFDFNAGRLDTTAHPFCCGIGPGDCRITTRFNPADFSSGLFGVLHEAGHGLYEQGLDPDHFGLPTGTAVSLGIHESQSRLLENQVGRSLEFWRFIYPLAIKFFPDQLSNIPLETFHKSINQVRPGFIRVDADEVTYNLHIIFRYELEKDLLSQNLSVKDLPDAWKAKMKTYLDLVPDNDATGCLQDIHWSAGLFGYFPTYLLGNLYAAQFIEKAKKVIGWNSNCLNLDVLSELRQWLKKNIHLKGKRLLPGKLCENVTGEKLDKKYFEQYLMQKFNS